VTRETLANVFAGTLALCAVTATALWVRREMIGPPEDIRIRKVSNWRDFAVGGHQFGAGGAPVEVVVFSDFQCSFCSVLAKRLDTIAERMGDTVSIRFRHFPMLNLHSLAGSAAGAAECAGQQGRFKEYHDALFANQDSIGLISWTQFATAAHLPDIEEFAHCAADSTTKPGVMADVEAGVELHVLGTPSLLVNDVVHRGAPTLAALESLVRKAFRSRVRLGGKVATSSLHERRSPPRSPSCASLELASPIVEELSALERRFGRELAVRIRGHEVCLGMSSELVRLAWGYPVTIVKGSRDGRQRSEWNYSSKVLSLIDDTVVAFR
jgi:protein-disulfide isomerase